MLRGGIVINEILIDPNGAQNFDTDGNGTADALDEYMEFFNTSASAIDLSGLQLWDFGVGQWFTFPPGSVLAAGGHALVMSGVQYGGSLPTGGPDDLFFSAGRNSPLINNTGDNVTVYDPLSDTFIQATYSNDALDNPTAGGNGYTGFSTTATRIGAGEDFGQHAPGVSLQRTGDGADVFDSLAPTPGTTNVCFADGSVIATPRGPVAIEDLRLCDLVHTADHGPQAVTWLYRCTWRADEVARNPKLAAVLIRADALGPGCPSSDLRLSQHHRIMVRGPIAQRMFARAEVLVPAKALLQLTGVSLEIPAVDVTYYHIMCARHEVIFANGVAAESLFLGAQARASIPAESLREICTLLGVRPVDLGRGGGWAKPARDLIKVQAATKLVARHIKNGRAVGCNDAHAWRQPAHWT